MNDDLALLREYARSGSEDAFAALVSRHVNLVYSVALWQVRDADLAEEITQAVFIVLAHKAGSLGDKTILSGWLCRTARYPIFRSWERRDSDLQGFRHFKPPFSPLHFQRLFERSGFARVDGDPIAAKVQLPFAPVALRCVNAVRSCLLVS